MKLKNTSSLCRDTELSSYTAYVFKADTENVICSEYIKFTVYAHMYQFVSVKSLCSR